mmetsp:Transcript_14580/g.41661  ORF Transcript_14580/g.41661 Transcript_14580/m.41661 type:complete len:311 (+) Transcript_14580:75-1007(+)
MAGLNWPGLLAWSTKYHDGTAPSNFKQLSDEDREFLEKAMEEAFGKLEDPNQVMAEAIQQIKAQDRTNEGIATALEVMDKCCDDRDCARNIEKLDGVQPLLDLLGSHPQFRARTLDIFSLLLQNNPKIQEVGFKRGCLGKFLSIARESELGSEERAKAFRALVALVRQVEAFEELLLREEGGVGLVVSCLDPAEDPRTHEKALSFAWSMATDARLLPGDVECLSAAILRLFPTMDGRTIQYRENLAGCAREFAQTFPTQCPPELTAAVQARLARLHVAKDPDCSEEHSTHQDFLVAIAARNGTATAPPAA